MNRLLARYWLTALAIGAAVAGGVLLTLAVIEFVEGLRGRWQLLIASLVALAVAVLAASYAPPGPNFVRRAGPLFGDQVRSAAAAVRGLFDRGLPQIAVGVLLTGVGTFFLFDTGTAQGTGDDLWWGLVAAVGTVLALAGVAASAKEVPISHRDPRVDVIRSARTRTQRLSGRAATAAEQANRMARFDESTSRTVQDLAARVERTAEEVARLEASAEELAAGLESAATRARERTAEAEADLRAATEALDRLEQARYAAPAADTDEADGDPDPDQPDAGSDETIDLDEADQPDAGGDETIDLDEADQPDAGGAESGAEDDNDQLDEAASDEGTR